MMIDKTIFLSMVRGVLREHPELMAETIEAASQGVLEKVNDNRAVSVDIQTSLSMLFDNQFEELSKENQKKVLRSILECYLYKGTPFAKKIAQKLKDLK